MTSEEILKYEDFREQLFEKAKVIAAAGTPKRYASDNHAPEFVEEGIYILIHDGKYMAGNVLVIWEELGVK